MIKTFPCIVLGIVLLLVACQSEPIVILDRSTSFPAGQSHVSTSSTVLSACEVKKQSFAMLPEQKPDWQEVGLSTCYQLNLDIPDDPKTYTGKALVTYTNPTQEEIPDLVFRLYPNASRIYGGNLAIVQAKANGGPVPWEGVLSDGTAVRLSLSTALSPGETVRVELEFQGQLPTDLTDNQTSYGIFQYDPEIPMLILANWFPILATRADGEWVFEPVNGLGDAVTSDSALYLVDVTAPSGWKVISTGLEIAAESEENRITHQISTGPVRDFTVVASPELVNSQTDVGGVHLNHWGFSENDNRWSVALKAARDSVTEFNKRFGPYPFGELDLVEVPLTKVSGVEYPGLVLLNTGIYEEDPERPSFLEQVSAHEVAHQWWYSIVGNDVQQHPWQDESLAMFSQLLYLESFQPQNYSGTMQYFQNMVSKFEVGSKDYQIKQPVVDFLTKPEAYTLVVYYKGGLFFEALREKLGDRIFFAGLADYYARNKYQLVQPEAILTSFEAACQCDLNAFYEEWGVQ